MNKENEFDVVIVGAGPAGASAAIRLANAGFRVALIEQKTFPRQKLCGEFVSPECLDLLDEIDVLPEVTAKNPAEIRRTVFYTRDGTGIAVESDWFGGQAGNAIGISRAELDLQILERARQTGVAIFMDTGFAGITKRVSSGYDVSLRPGIGGETSVDGLVIIDATGRNRSVARRLEKRTSTLQPAKHVAFKAHLRGAHLDEGTCEIYVYQGGYGGCNRIENGSYNLCFIASADDTKRMGSDPNRVMNEILFQNKSARETIRVASIESDWLAVPIERFGRGNLTPANGVLAIGDAASFIDPFTGSGILMALQSAKIAAEAISSQFTRDSGFEKLAADYAAEYGRTFDRRLKISSFLRRAAFSPVLAESLIRGLSWSGMLRRRIARATREPSRSVTS